VNTIDLNRIEVNGVQYVKADSVQPKPTGTRAVIVADRGWIFAGDVTRKEGRIYLSRAVWVFSWSSVGFAAVVADPKKAKADIRPIADVDMPADAELFCVPVGDTWGL
jgi:hypothetical protein